MIQIVQCWDDGVEDDIRLVEILRKHGAKASFNLNAALHGPRRGEPWRYKEVKDVRQLAKAELVDVYEGFTIANHTLTHPWLEKISPEQIRTEIFEGRKQLQDLFGQEVSGFAYPYGQHPPAATEAVREAGHVYARTCVNRHPAFPVVGDPMQLASDCHFLSPSFWEYYEEAKCSGAPIFYFWGHSYELVTQEDWLSFERKIERIKADPEAVWADLPSVFTL
jgi:hypothetical protein